MTKKTFVPLLGAIALLASCAENEIVDKGAIPSSDLISFGTYMKPSGRAAAVGSLDDLKTKNFKVFAAYTGTNTWAAATDKTPNFMYNDAVTWDATAAAGNGAWTYTGAKYWPQSGNVTFYAYSPNLSSNLVHSLATVTADPSFTYTVPNDVDAQEDLLADIVADKTKADGTVRFDFDHLLSKVGFAAKLNADYTGATVKVTKMQITYGTDAIKNKATYAYAEDNTVAGIWTAAEGAMSGSNELQPTEGVTLNSTTSSDLNDTDKYLMMLPQTTTAAALKARIEYEVSYTDSVKTENVAIIDLPECSWLPGKQYTYNFNISLSAVTFDVIAVNPWEEGTTVALKDEAGEPVGVANIPATFTAETGSESNQTTFAVTGAVSMDPVNSTNFNATFTSSPSRAVAGGTLTIKPKVENTGTSAIEETINVTFTDELNNKKTFSFNAKQFAPLSLSLSNTKYVAGTYSAIFKSDASAYQFNNTTASSFAFTVAGATTGGVSVSLDNSTDFTEEHTDNSITFTAKNPLIIGSVNKTATATITLTGNGDGNTQSFTINLTQYALAYITRNGESIDGKRYIYRKDAGGVSKDFTINNGSVKEANEWSNDKVRDRMQTPTFSGNSLNITSASLKGLETGLAYNWTSTLKVIITNMAGEESTYYLNVRRQGGNSIGNTDDYENI